ncbi:DUF1127 domain-containing protein [Albibacillus kandeliae]|uniref:DUF1127 domain-containing protein n=1 Tax=Albibacillus kandeliae TaxID=2174228 RepID=UPI000D691EF3|nr:DUF1127 domain-containing protein [Albibacillus kandeliae]
MAHNISLPAQPHGLSNRLRNLVGDIKDALARRAVYRKTLAELSSLSNRDLGDLGISRSGIRRLALEAAYGNN